MNSTDIINQEKDFALKRRNRAILWLRLFSGIKEIYTQPWKGISVVLLCIAFLFIWIRHDTLSILFSNNIPLLSTIYGYLIAVFIPLLFLLLLAGLMYFLGTPFKANEKESSLREIGLTNLYGHAPVMISKKRIKNTDVSIMEFYSHGVSMERWKQKKADVLDALDIHFAEDIKYGGRNGRNRNIIVITAAPGAETRREDALYDDEI